MLDQDDSDSIDNVIDLTSGKPLGQLSWFKRLQRNREHTIRPTVSNAAILLRNDPVLRGSLAYNAFRCEHLILRPPPIVDEGAPEMPGPYPRPWAVEDVVLMQAYLQRVWAHQFPRGTVEDAMLAVAALSRFHPITDWLDTLAWDRIPRLDSWLTQAFGCEDTAYHRAVGAKFLVAAVRRVRQPGYKFDHMLILEGDQGIGKSLSLAELFGHDWFSDSMPIDLGSRDAAMALLGTWCMECAEIDHLVRNDDEATKAFLTRSHDKYRPPYAKAYVDRPRQNVFAGTTNQDDYLRDISGNRRYWPVRCAAASPNWIRLNRTDLWAEAAWREAQGDPVWLADEEVRDLATAEQLERLTANMWGDIVHQWLAGRVEVRIPDILTDALQIPRERLGVKNHEMNVARILKQLGWRKSVRRRSGALTKLWFAPDYDPDDPKNW